MGELLVIQTAFLGDVILVTPLIRYLHEKYPGRRIHVLVRKGNESLLSNHPLVDKIWIWDKKQNKYRHLWQLLWRLRKIRFEKVFNAQRHGSTALLTLLLRSTYKAGFRAHVLSRFFHYRAEHHIPFPFEGRYLHEVERNLLLAGVQPKARPPRPELYPHPEDEAYAQQFPDDKPYFVVAPASVWFTKQWPAEKWIELIRRLPEAMRVFIIGSPADKALGALIQQEVPRVFNLCGRLSLLQSAALMRDAERVFVNDSAPLHLASSVNAPVTAVFCSTRPTYGFGPLSDQARVVEAPGGTCCTTSIRGLAACPEKHFRCAWEIPPGQVFTTLEIARSLCKVETYRERNQAAVAHLSKGGLILQDTDTIPGLAADALQPEAVAELARIKGHTMKKPFIVLCSNWAMLNQYISFAEEGSLELARMGATIIYPKARGLPEEILADNETIGIRIPKSKELVDLIEQLGNPIVSTSANISGDPAPAFLEEVDPQIMEKVNYCICYAVEKMEEKKPSTILQLSKNSFKLYREGHNFSMIREWLNRRGYQQQSP